MPRPATFGQLAAAARPAFGSAALRSGRQRWLGALGLAGFTLLATGIALRFWEMPAGHERFMAANAFFEHLGRVGGFLLVAWLDLREQTA
jgi:uncharacterized membrane protein YphA (DoxX/SURF4 family)